MVDDHPPVHSHVGMFGKKGNYSTHGHKFELDKDFSKYALQYTCSELATLIKHGENPIIITSAIPLRKLSRKHRKDYLEQRERLRQYIAEDEAKKKAQESTEDLNK